MRILLFVLIPLVIRLYAYYAHPQISFKNNQKVFIQTTLLNEPKVSGTKQQFVIVVDGNKFFVVAKRYPAFHYGQFVRIFGTVKKRVTTNKNIALTIYSSKIEAEKKDRNFLSLISFIRQKIILLFQQSLPPTEASLLLGIVFGIKDNMPNDFFEKLRMVGVLHVIAASGMNVTMLAGVLSSFFIVFFRRQTATILAIFGIVFYAFLSGLEPSIVRAGVMGVLVFVAQIFGRQYIATYALFLAGSTMLFIDPKLLYDVGFQLSFAATLGLIYIQPLFGMHKKWFINEDVLVTLSAQIATLPILLFHFGTYSLVSVIANAVLLWTVPILMVLGGIAAVVGFLVEQMARILIYLCIPLLWYFEYIVNLFSKFGSTFSVASFPWQWMVSYYLFLALFVSRLRK